MKRFLAIAAIALALSSCTSYDTGKIAQAVAEQMEQYPESTLVDLYKYFYQDVYGPGHMIADSERAAMELESESFLQLDAPYGGITFEKTGAEGNYYRVSLFCVSSGMVKYERMVDAFIRSARKNTPSDDATFRKVWPVVASAAAAYDIPGYESDLEQLNALVASDSSDKAVHHSDAYKNAYDPHYRIIERDIFLKEIYPNLDL